MWDVLQLDGVKIFAKWLASAGCEELKIELSGVPLERSMSSSGLGQADDDDDSYKKMVDSIMSEILIALTAKCACSAASSSGSKPDTSSARGRWSTDWLALNAFAPRV